MVFGKKRARFSWNVIDMHCHILPGLDDGARDLPEALAMLRAAADEGISAMVATPHFHPGRYTASPEAVLRALWDLRKAAAAEGIPVRLYPGSEVWYFDDLPGCLGRRELCTMNGTPSVLVEFPPAVLFRTLQNAMDRLLGEGYRPILAHAERCGCLLKEPDGAFLLRDMGARIQVNAAAVAGKDGAEGKRFVHGLLKARAVDFIGTDAHRSDRRRPEAARCREILIRRYGDAYTRRVMRENALAELGAQDTER